MQTLMSFVLYRNIEPVIFDKKELYILSNGDEKYLAYKGTFNDDSDSCVRPVVVIIPGIFNTHDTPCIIKFVKYLQERSYDAVVINHIGDLGAKIKNEKPYFIGSYKDYLEPIHYIKENYCKNRKMVLLGISMGADIGGNLLGHMGECNDQTLNAAFCCAVAPRK